MVKTMRFSMKRICITLALGVGMVALSAAPSVDAAGQAGDTGIVGTWTSAVNDGHGGTNYSWYTFAQDGSYRMVSSILGGANNGSKIQRWGQWQARQVGPGQFQTLVHVTGGAPQQICSQGQGCTPVQGIQATYNWQLRVQNGQLMQGSSVFQRGQVPQELAQQLPATRMVQGPVAPSITPYTTPGRRPGGDVTNTPGLGKNCDDLQQQRICDNGNLVRNHDTGCLVCYK
jgi:hypothetical protein